MPLEMLAPTLEWSLISLMLALLLLPIGLYLLGPWSYRRLEILESIQGPSVTHYLKLFHPNQKGMRDLAYSLRGAQEIANLIEELDGNDVEDKALADQTLNAIASALAIHRAALERSLREIAEDPYTNFICEVWESRCVRS